MSDSPPLVHVFSTALVVLVLLSCKAPASVEQVPNPRHDDSWVSDNANLLSDEAQRRIDDRIDDLESRTGVEIAVVTVYDVNAPTPRDFATRLFNEWGIGKADRDNGLLILLVEDQRRLEMETGYGLEAQLTDAWLKQLQESEMVPHFRSGNFDRGLEAGVDAVIARLDGASDTPEFSNGSRDPDYTQGIINLLVFVGLFVLLAVFIAGPHYLNSRRKVCPGCNLKMQRDRSDPNDGANHRVYACSDCNFRRGIDASHYGAGSSMGTTTGSSSSGGSSFGGGSSGGGGAGSSW